MDTADPILLVAAASLVAMVLTPLASRMIASATAQISRELSDEDPELSRIRRRR